MKALASVGAFFCFMAVLSCGSKTTAPATSTVTTSSVAIAAASIFTGPGQQVQFTATATMSDGTTQNVSSQAAWQSSNTSVLTVSSTGLATSVTEGDAKLTATYTGVTGSSDVAVRIQWSVKGRMLSAADGAPLTGGFGIAVEAGVQQITGSSDGAYSISGLGSPTSKTIQVSATGFVTRSTTLSVNGARTGVDISLISLASPFSLTFYREFLRGAADNNGLLQNSFRWDVSPSFYINTRNGGSEMPASVIADLVASLPALVTQVSDGRLSVQRIETGTENRPQIAGWINVDYTTSITSCGAAAVGGNLVRIHPNCSDLTFVGLHETTHALGFWHHTEAGGLMSRTAPTPGLRGLNAVEALHTKIAFSRPRGNADPDADPLTTRLAMPEPPTTDRMLACWAIR